MASEMIKFEEFVPQPTPTIARQTVHPDMRGTGRKSFNPATSYVDSSENKSEFKDSLFDGMR